jgi:hypothetical protein
MRTFTYLYPSSGPRPVAREARLHHDNVGTTTILAMESERWETASSRGRARCV